MQLIYEKYSFIIEQGRSQCSIVEETKIEFVGFAGAPYLWGSFKRYRLEWMTQYLGSYSPIIVWEFYASSLLGYPI